LRPNRLATRFVLLAGCFVLSVVIAYFTFSLAWSPSPRFSFTIAPGAFLAIAVNRIVRLPTSGAGFVALFLTAHVLVCFCFVLAAAWVVSRLSRSRHRAAPQRSENVV
jgi:hypothetical protein